MPNDLRYHVVVVSAFIGMYRKHDPIAFAIADHERANSIVSRKYSSEQEAQTDCDRLNNGSAVTHAEVKRNLGLGE